MGIPWVQVETDFILAKSKLIAVDIGISQDEVIGKVTRLWGTAISTLSVSKSSAKKLFESSTICAIIDWKNDEKIFVNSLKNNGILEEIDGQYRICGLDRYTKTIEKQDVDAARQRKHRGVTKGVTSRVTSDGCSRVELELELELDKDHNNIKENTKEKSAAPPISVSENSTNSNPQKPSSEDVRAFQMIWNEVADSRLPRWKETPKSRALKAKQRLSERELWQWRDLIMRINATPFLLGKSDGGWRADIDFLLQPETATKILEGKYKALKPPRCAVKGCADSAEATATGYFCEAHHPNKIIQFSLQEATHG